MKNHHHPKPKKQLQDNIEYLRLRARQAYMYEAFLLSAKPNLEAIKNFIDMWDKKPITRTDDEFYAIHTGSEFEASLRLSDLRALSQLIENIKKIAGQTPEIDVQPPPEPPQ